MEENFNKLIEQIDIFAKENLKESRYQHSHRVANYAKFLAEHHSAEGVNPDKAFFAGLAHDMCKNFSDEELVATVEKDGMGIDDIEKTRLNLLHGRAAAVLLKEKFAVKDKSILNAIAFHTFGYEGIDALGKMVYIADKIEPARPNTEEFRDFALKATLTELMLKVLLWNMNYIKSKAGRIHPLTDKMYKQLKDELAQEEKDN